VAQQHNSQQYGRRVCDLGGVTLTNRLATLQDLERPLKIAIQDANGAEQSEYFWRAMETVAKIVAVSCDLAIEALVETAEKVPGASGPALGVSAVYDVAKLIVDGANGDLSVKKAFIYSGGVKLDALTSILTERGNHRISKAIISLKVFISTLDDLREYWEAHGRDNFEKPSGIVGAKRTAIGILHRLQIQISTLKGAIAACS